MQPNQPQQPQDPSQDATGQPSVPDITSDVSQPQGAPADNTIDQAANSFADPGATDSPSTDSSFDTPLAQNSEASPTVSTNVPNSSFDNTPPAMDVVQPVQPPAPAEESITPTAPPQDPIAAPSPTGDTQMPITPSTPVSSQGHQSKMGVIVVITIMVVAVLGLIAVGVLLFL